MPFVAGVSHGAIGVAYDRYGTQLFRLAHMICRDDDMASMAVAHAFDAAFADASLAVEEPWVGHRLARFTYLACTLMCPAPSDPPLHSPAAADTVTELKRGGLLGLTIHGDHTYREAAILLGINPTIAAEILRTTLRASAIPARLQQPGSNE